MKLKGLSPRAYNILFHTHTVSGIIISVVLYIIFFAGAFTLFKDELYLWENPDARRQATGEVNIKNVLEATAKKAPAIDWNEDLNLRMPTAINPLVTVYGHLKTARGKGEEHFELTVHPATLQTAPADASAIGETLYRLHFLDQLPLFGRYLAGFVAFFFLFASITGVLIHWRNIFTRFWGFSLKHSWKQIWTNAHTVFGLLGLPFQVMYAVTGAFYLLLALVLLPPVLVLYEGNAQEIYQWVQPSLRISFNPQASDRDNRDDLEQLQKKVNTEYPGFSVRYIALKHLSKADAFVEFNLQSKDPTRFDTYGSVGYRIHGGKELYKVIPGYNKTYVQQVLNGMSRLHFATFGGVFLKGLYFLMALFTCFVIISGILLWKEARKNKKYTQAQQRFHQRVTLAYLSVCLSLFPAVAILFCAELLVASQEDHSFWVNATFFGSWLGLCLLGVLTKTEQRLTYMYLILLAIVALAVPVTNGIITHDWLWYTWTSHPYSLFAIDVFWLVVALGATIVVIRASNPFAESSPDNLSEKAKPSVLHRVL